MPVPDLVVSNMPDVRLFEIESRIENLEKVVSWINGFCAEYAPAAVFEHKLQIATEELLVNIITHGYGVDQKDALIRLALYPQPEGVVMVIEDDAAPFDPLENVPLPNTKAAIKDRQIGGLGVMLVREMADRVTYSHLQHNRIALVFGPGELPYVTDAGCQRNPLPNSLHDDPNTRTRSNETTRFRPADLTLRILVVLILLSVSSLAASGAMNFLKFEKVLTVTTTAKYDPVLRELGRVISDSLKDKLILASIQSTGDLIKRSVRQFDGAFDLTVENSTGTVLFTTLSDMKISNGEKTVNAPPSPGNIQHVSDTLNRFTSRMAILQNGESVGVLSLSHDTTMARAALSDLARQLTHAGIISILLVLPLLMLAALFILGRVDGQLHDRKIAVRRAIDPTTSDPGPSDALVQAVWRIGQAFLKGQSK